MDEPVDRPQRLVGREAPFLGPSEKIGDRHTSAPALGQEQGYPLLDDAFRLRHVAASGPEGHRFSRANPGVGGQPYRRGAGCARMSLPLSQTAQPAQARFTHENGTQLRMQCFLAVRNAEGRVATVRVQGIDGWALPGESMLLNESPDQAAARVAKMWFDTPLPAIQLDRILSFPATGPDDDRWYLLFVYHADAPADLKGTPDTQELRFRSPREAPEKWAMSHADVWPQLW